MREVAQRMLLYISSRSVAHAKITLKCMLFLDAAVFPDPGVGCPGLNSPPSLLSILQ